MTHALSQIFVISLQDSGVGNEPRAVAHYLDMLGDKGLSNYRELLESVSLHPVMGTHLTSIRKRKADPRTGRVPDENYAREVMQLFSIGLIELNDDGSAKQASGAARETYGPADIAGLSDPERWTKPMVGCPQYHGTEEKTFLGTTIAPQGAADAAASLKTALDTLHNHPNVGPFIGKQLIQRVVTSNPSTAYVASVAAAFNNNGAGVRGDMKAVLKAVLLHPEARVTSDRSGKIREPILRLSALLRGFGYASDSGRFRVGNTDNAGTSLGQTALRSPTVFNFYRPGYVAPGNEVRQYQVTSNGAIRLGTSADGQVYGSAAVGQAMERIVQTTRGGRLLEMDLSAAAARSMQAESLLRNALKPASDPPFGTPPATDSDSAANDPKLRYPDPNNTANIVANPLAQQLRMVARLAHALRGFHDMLGALGVRNQVTTFPVYGTKNASNNNSSAVPTSAATAPCCPPPRGASSVPHWAGGSGSVTLSCETCSRTLQTSRPATSAS